MKLKEFSITLTILTLTVLFQALPIYHLFIRGPYNWHIKQPEVVQGGVELIIIFFILSILQLILKNKKILLYLLFIIIGGYLIIHKVLIPVAAAIIYFEIIISFGFWLMKCLKMKKCEELIDYIIAFTVGTAFWSVFAIILSAAGFGRFQDLRILTLFVALISITKGLNRPLLVELSYKFIQSSNKENILNIFILMIISLQLAKSVSAFDYDSIWYGLRPEFVLIGEHSFFDHLGLTNFVHYYPKLMELFFVPISNLGDYSFIYAGNVAAYTLLLISIYLLGRLFEMTKLDSLFITVVLGSIPVVANFSSTAKADIFTTLLMMIGVDCIIYAHKTSSRLINIYGYCAWVLAFGSKLTSFAYLPFVLIGLWAAVAIEKIYNNKPMNLKLYLSNELIMLGVSLTSLFGISFRTYLLTGYPVYPSFRGVWNSVGFMSLYPFGFNEAKSIVKIYLPNIFELLHRWYEVLFNPKEMPHIIMAWTGNVVIFLFIVVLIFALFLRKKFYNNRFAILIFLPAVFLGIYLISTINVSGDGNDYKGGDGNYYIFPLILGGVLLFSYIAQLGTFFKKYIYMSLIVFISFQMVYMFVSHFSWAYGTEEFDIRFNKSIFDSKQYNVRMFKSKGISIIADYVSNHTPVARAIGYDKEDGFIINMLPCRTEMITFMLSSHYGVPEVFSNENEFIKYLKWAKINYLIMPHAQKEIHPTINHVINKLKIRTDIKVIQDKNYYLLDISQLTRN